MLTASTTDYKNLVEGLNNEQKEAVIQPLDICTKIVAGAGTGKTKIISKRFCKLYLDLKEKNISNPLSKILVITFTDKAAQEMKSRIIKELQNNNIDTSETDFLISTFHKFCSMLLKRHSQEAGLSPNYKLADTITLEEVYENIIRKIEYLELDTIYEIDEITSYLGIDKDILLPQNLLKLSQIADIDDIFNEIFSVIKKIKSLGLSAKEFYTKTINTTKQYSKIIKSLPIKAKDKEEFIQNWTDILKNYADENSYEYFKDLAKTGVIINQNRSQKPEKWTYADNFPDVVDKEEELEIYFCKVTALLYEIYKRELKRLNLVDYDDLINYPIEILKNNDELKTYYKDYFQHIIIDEFQDTNGSQLELIKLLLRNETPNITFVGDRKQSIYGFRYSQMENLDTLGYYIEQKYKKQIKTIQLETNYRSDEAILKAVNYVTTSLLQLDESIHSPDRNLTHTEDVKSTVLSDITDSYDHNIKEAESIGCEILKLKEERNLKYSDFAILVRTNSHADFLYKELKKQNIPCIKSVNTDFFKSSTVKNILALLKLAKNFYDEQALIRILQIELSDFQLYSLAKLANDKIYESEYQSQLKSMNFNEKAEYLKNNNFITNEYLDSTTVDYVTNIFDLFGNPELKLNKLNINFLLTKIINTISPYKKNDILQIQEAEREILTVQKIVEEFSKSRAYTSITDVLKYFEKISVDKDFEIPKNNLENTDAVTLLTIHSSKGLEFNYLFLTSIKNREKNDTNKIILDLQYDNKPGFGLIIKKIAGKDTPKSHVYSKIWASPRNKSEALRLFYVALSRAKKYLNVYSFEKYGVNKPANYLEEYTLSGVTK